MKFGTGSMTELTQKCEGQSTKMPYVRPNTYKLVVRSNSANAWRASRLFLQKNRTEITSNCSAQCNPFHSQLASENLKSLIPD